MVSRNWILPRVLGLVALGISMPSLSTAASIEEQKEEYQRGSLTGCLESTSRANVDPEIAKAYCNCQAVETMKNINNGLTDQQFRELVAGSKGAKKLSDIPHADIAFRGVLEKCRPGNK